MTDGDAEAGRDEDAEAADRDADGDRPERPDDGAVADVPLDIAGHEDRAPPGEREEDAVSDGEVDSDGGANGDEEADGDVAEDGGGALPDVGTPSTPDLGFDLDSIDTGPASEDDEAPGDDAEGEDADGDDPDGDDTGDETDGDRAEEGDEEVEPIELLVQLAKDGEIDPWDVDVVQVTEEFLAALDDGDLRQSGRALFYASVLVRMKSDVLLEPDQQAEAEDPWDAPMDAVEDAPPAFDPVDSLETEMQRRLDRKHVRGSPETLDELVRELREAERGTWWKESREYDTSGSPAGYARGAQTVDYHLDDDRRMDGEPTAREVTERTHAEDIEQIIEDVRSALAEHYEAGRPEVLFREVEDAGGSRVESFLAVLFLANRGEVRLQQDRLFGDLWLQDPAADLGAEGAVAD